MSIKLMSQVWEKDLPQNQTLVLLALADHANDDGRCYPSIRRVAWKTGYSERSVQRIIRILEDEQIVNVHKEAPGTPGKPRVYQLTLANAKPKQPFVTGDNLTPLENEGSPEGVTPLSQTGDKSSATGDTSDGTGDIAVTPEPSVNHQREPLKKTKPLRSAREKTECSYCKSEMRNNGGGMLECLNPECGHWMVVKAS